MSPRGAESAPGESLALGKAPAHRAGVPDLRHIV